MRMLAWFEHGHDKVEGILGLCQALLELLLAVREATVEVGALAGALKVRAQLQGGPLGLPAALLLACLGHCDGQLPIQHRVGHDPHIPVQIQEQQPSCFHATCTWLESDTCACINIIFCTFHSERDGVMLVHFLLSTRAYALIHTHSSTDKWEILPLAMAVCVLIGALADCIIALC